MTTSPTLILEHTNALLMNVIMHRRIHDILTHPQVGFNDFNDIDDIGQPSRRVHLDGESGLETSTEDHNCSRYVKKLKNKEEEKSNEPAETFSNPWRRRGRTT